MMASLHNRIRHLFGALALGFLLLALASCGGGGSGVPSDGGPVVGEPNHGGSEGSAGGTDGAGDGSSSGTGGGVGSGESASSGGIGGTGGTPGDGSSGDTGTADSGGGGGGIGGTGGPSTAGAVHFYLADAPSCGYDAVYVTVQKVRIHASGGANEGDAGWSEVAQTPLKRVDLLTLTNGVLADLGQTSLPPGKYTQLRLVLAENGSQAPFPNAVVPTGAARETELKVPSGSQSGLKIDADVDVVAGKTTSLVLDFDACKSVVRRGNSGQFNLRPVISAIPLASEVGLRVTGYVAPGLANASTKVSVQLNGMPVRSTAVESTGRFVLYPVPSGAYDLVVTSGGRVTAVLTGVPVTTAAPTAVSSAARPIDPPPSIERGVSGTVNPPSATVRALQTLSGGRLVEVGWAPVDALGGGFAFTLPPDPPIRASYASDPGALTFVADPTVGGNVILEATSGAQVKTQPVNLNASPTSVTFTFP